MFIQAKGFYIYVRLLDKLPIVVNLTISKFSKKGVTPEFIRFCDFIITNKILLIV